MTDDAVVATLTVIFIAEMPGVTGLGETVQLDSEGAPAHVKLTLWLNPPTPATLRTKVAGDPGATVATVDEPAAALTEKSTPVPLSATVRGLSTALSAMDREPASRPLAVGAKLTLIVQELLLATAAAQLLVWPKLSLVPMLVMLSVPVLLNVTCCDPLVVPKF